MLVADVHERIRELVLAKTKSREVTGAALAKHIGVAQAHISNFLAGKRRLSIEAMDGILEALHLEVGDLLPSEEFINPGDVKADSELVPLIALELAMHPRIAPSRILELVKFSKTFLRRLRRDAMEERESWERFIALKTNSGSSDPMYPRLGHGAIALIDRRYCSLRPYRKNVPNLYLVRKGEECLIRQVELQGAVICLRPESRNHPLDFISLSPKDTLASCIVGRVAQIAAET